MNTLKFALGSCLSLLLAASAVYAEEQVEIVDHTMLMDHGDGHLMDMEGGMVMGQNKDKLPAGCDRVSEEKEITVRAGHKYSKDHPGTMFAFDQQEFRFKPCTRLTVHFVNEDRVRHQWMMHGLPKFLYDKGMFHLEVTGPAKISGTLILPKEDKTYLVHCDIAQHMEKGMKAQLIVGKGSGTFPSIPGVTDLAIADHYGPSAAAPAALAGPAGSTGSRPVEAAPPAVSGTWFSGTMIIGLLIGIFGAPFASRAWKSYFNGMTGKDALKILGLTLKRIADGSVALFDWLWREIQRRMQQRRPGGAQPRK